MYNSVWSGQDSFPKVELTWWSTVGSSFTMNSRIELCKFNWAASVSKRGSTFSFLFRTFNRAHEEFLNFGMTRSVDSSASILSMPRNRITSSINVCFSSESERSSSDWNVRKRQDDAYQQKRPRQVNCSIFQSRDTLPSSTLNTSPTFFFSEMRRFPPTT